MDDMPSDEELVKGMRAGNELAFDRFFREYSPRVYRFVLPRMRGQQHPAEEVCQEVLSRAMRRIDGWRGEAALFTWLCQIARNEVTDYWRKQGRRGQVEVFAEDDPEIAAALESIEAGELAQPERQCTSSEVARMVQVALDTLPSSYGHALEWKYIDGLSVAEIAGRLDRNLIATQSLLARARGAFRDAYGSLTGGTLSDALPLGMGDRTHD